MTTQMPSTTLSRPSIPRVGWLIAAFGVVVAAAIAIGVIGWQARDDGDTRATVTAPAAPSTSVEANPHIGGMGELYRDQQAASSSTPDTLGLPERYGEPAVSSSAVDTRGGLGELYGEQEAARRAAEPRPANPCSVVEGDVPHDC